MLDGPVIAYMLAPVLSIVAKTTSRGLLDIYHMKRDDELLIIVKPKCDCVWYWYYFVENDVHDHAILILIASNDVLTLKTYS